VALKVLPNGQQPGRVFEESEVVGRILVEAKAARLATEEDLQTPSRRRYRRRDLEASTD
jgi:hypothetical protein